MAWCICAAVIAAQISAGFSQVIANDAIGPQRENHTTNSAQELIIRGVVRDFADRPMGGAAIGVVAVSLRPKSDPLSGSTFATQVGQATSAVDGRFQFSVRNMTRDDIALELSARAPGHGVALLDLPIDAALHDVALELPKENRFRATLLAPDGKPFANAKIKLCGLLPVSGSSNAPQWYSAPPSGVLSWPPNCTSGSDGSIELLGSASVGAMLLEIDDERVARQRWTVATDKPNVPISLNTLPPRSAQGKVVVSDAREPIAGVDVVLTSWNGDDYVGAVTTKSDKQGAFSLRVYAGDSLTIRAQLADSNFQKLDRHIPWIEGTIRQHMVLPLYRAGTMPEDGTTPDGRLASTIDSEVPATAVTTRHPTRPILSALPGVLVVSETPIGGEHTWHRVVAINPESGHSRVLIENGLDGRVSPDGRQILYRSGSSSGELRIAAADATAMSKLVVKRPAGPASWLDGVGLIANINDPTPQDYFGQEYWPLETTKHRITVSGDRLCQISVPPPYQVFDVSHDGKLLAMHWDTHATPTGAQLFVADIDGSKLRPIARKSSQYYWYPRFSPDDKSIVAKHLDAKTGALTIRIVALDGAQERSIILSNEVGPEIACWSPDGAWIAIVAYDQAAFAGGKKVSHLFVVNSAGDCIREIMSDDRGERHITNIDWSASLPIAK